MFRMVLKIFFLPLFFLMACGKQQANQRQPGEKIKIVATTGMIGDAVKEIAGEHADVVALMGAGVDPHLYKATHGDLERLTDADIIFYNGLHLEGKMGEVFDKLARTRPVIAIGDELPESELRKVPGFQGAFDPHIWFDVKLWSEAVGTISTHLQKYDSTIVLTFAFTMPTYVPSGVPRSPIASEKRRPPILTFHPFSRQPSTTASIDL